MAEAGTQVSPAVSVDLSPLNPTNSLKEGDAPPLLSAFPRRVDAMPSLSQRRAPQLKEKQRSEEENMRWEVLLFEG